MGTTPAQRAKRMFDVQSRTLTTHDGTQVKIVICPVCRFFFDEDHLSEDHGDCCDVYLTVEDAPTIQEANRLELPGNSRRALTCSDCNNGAGKSFENEHALLLNKYLPEAQRKIGIIKAELLAAAHEPHPDGETCSHSTRASRVIDVSKVFEAAQASRVMELKEAYIIAFSALGYTYAMTSQLDAIRAWVQPGATQIPVESCAPIDEDFLPARHVAVLSGDIHGVAVSVPAHHANDGPHAVFLPRPGGLGGADFYADLKSKSTRRVNIDELHPWPKSGHPKFDWDRCNGSHRRTTERWGSELGDIDLYDRANNQEDAA